MDLNIEKIESDDLELQGIIATDAPSHILGNKHQRQWREVIPNGVFSDALAKSRMIGRDIDFYVDHDKSKILASTSNNSLKLEEDEYGLYIDAKISPTTWGKDLFVLVKDGIIKGLSFGMKVLRDNWSRDTDGVPLRTILEIDLFEISALKVPAYPQTLLESRGLEVEEVEIPDNLEERSIGGNTMNNEITPQMFYDGMVLIAEKLDAIIGKFDEAQENKTIEGLAEAKDILTKTQALVDAQTQTHVTAGAPSEAVVEGRSEDLNEVEDKSKLNENPDDAEKLIPDENSSNPDEKPIEEKGKEEQPSDPNLEKQDEETKVEDEEKAPEEENKDPEANPEEKPQEKQEEKDSEVPSDEQKEEETEEDKKKKQVNEYRSLLQTLTQEVPEIE